MSWSYDASLSTNRDKVRLKIGDIDTADQLLSNETLDALLTEHNSDILLTSISAVRAIIASYTRTVARSAAGMSADTTVFFSHYQELLADLLKQNRGNSGARYSGSFSRSRHDTINDDSDFVKPDFRRGEYDYPGTGNVSEDKDSEEYGG
tara:strand:+ start:25099 stop:25548 length:450 start_codon:yes stop_codon:yes gene_type:complete